MPTSQKNTLTVGWRHYTTFLTRATRGEFPHPNRNVDVREELGRFGRPSLALLGLSLSAGAVTGTAGALLARLRKRRTGWELGVFTGMVLPESIVAALLWLGAFWLITTWNYKPFPIMWITDISWRHYVLPVASMAAFPAAYVGRAVSTALDEVYAQTYVKVARAKGLSEWQVVMGHVFRHAAHRLSNTLPSLLAWSLSSLIVVEWIFQIPGLGRSTGFMLWSNAIDPFRLGAFLTVFMLIATLLHIACTLWASWLDPREGSA